MKRKHFTSLDLLGTRPPGRLSPSLIVAVAAFLCNAIAQQKKNATKTKRAIETEDAPMFNVLVIGDEEYSREHVVLSIQDIVPDTDNTRVRRNKITSSGGEGRRVRAAGVGPVAATGISSAYLGWRTYSYVCVTCISCRKIGLAEVKVSKNFYE